MTPKQRRIVIEELEESAEACRLLAGVVGDQWGRSFHAARAEAFEAAIAALALPAPRSTAHPPGYEVTV